MEPTLFPQGYATGEAFFNRDTERNQLASSFKHGEHTVVIAPRRYGKTSLIKQVLLDLNIPGHRMDFLPATNDHFVQRAIKKCVSDLMSEIAPKTKRAKQVLLDFIRDYHPRLTLSLMGQYLEVGAIQAPEQGISDLLVSLNTAAEKLKKRVVVCFDEFQQVGLLKNNHTIEASIRHAVEASTYVTYVFSGSSRHLLSQMFHTKNRPLYHLCDLMKLERINKDTYLDILYEKATQRWSGTISKKALSELLTQTKCHTYYVNALCRHLWKQKKPMSVSSVQRAWLDYIDIQSSWITDDLARLSPNQRNILAAIAYGQVEEPFSQDFSGKVKLSASSIKTSLNVLLRNDLIFVDNSGVYQVLDPAIETYLHSIRSFDFLE